MRRRNVGAGVMALGLLLAQPVHAQGDPDTSAAIYNALTPAGQAGARIDNGLEAAKAGDFAKALALFREAQGINPSDPAIWYDLGLASTHIPGNEFRAAAFFKAYLLAEPDSPRAAAIGKVMDQLAAKVDAEIGALIDQARETAPQFGVATEPPDCKAPAGDVRVALLEAEAGHADAALTQLRRLPQPGQLCGYLIARQAAAIAQAFAVGRHTKDAEIYAAIWEQNRRKDGEKAWLSDDSSILPYQALATAYVKDGDLMTRAPAADARVMAALDAFHRHAPSWAPTTHFQPAYARLMTCAYARHYDASQGVPAFLIPGGVQKFLDDRRDAAVRDNQIHPDFVIDELVRDAATFAAIDSGHYETETAQAIPDGQQRTAWSGYVVTPDSVHPGVQAAAKIVAALPGEDALLACLGAGYFEPRLVQLGLDGFELDGCSVHDDDLALCLSRIQTWRGEVTDKFHAIGRVITTLIAMRDELFAPHWYETKPAGA